MKLVEFTGPSASGKSSIYAEMVEIGGFVENPAFPVEDAVKIIEGVRGKNSQLDDFIALLDYMTRATKADTDDANGRRMCGILRAFAKVILARLHKDPQWMVVDGGLIHRGQSVDQLVPKMPLRRYFELMPPPDMVFAVKCDKEILAERNQSRDDTDRSDDLDRALACHKLGMEVLKKRGALIVPVDTTTVKPDKAARMCLTRMGVMRKYEGERAVNYDADRSDQAKWHVEQQIIEAMLADLPEKSWVLDAPCGTGRFFDCYQRHNFIVRGLDISADMIAQATRKVKEPTKIIDGHAQFQFIQGDVRNTKLPDKSVDAAVACRITRWLIEKDGAEGVHAMLKEMQRVAKAKIIVTARVHHAKAPELSCTYEMINAGLDGWRIARDEPGGIGPADAPVVDETYRILCIEPT